MFKNAYMDKYWIVFLIANIRTYERNKLEAIVWFQAAKRIRTLRDSLSYDPIYNSIVYTVTIALV